jgi:long-chain fatty acid transport protein
MRPNEFAPRASKRAARSLTAATLALAALFSARAAHATSTFEIAGAPVSSNPLAARVLGAGVASTYFNPALLPDSGSSTLVGVFVLSSQLDINLDPRPPGADVSSDIYKAQLGGPNGSTRLAVYPLPTADLPNPRSNTHVRDTTTYAILGLVWPLVSNHLVFGVYTQLPVHSFLEQRGFFVDEREQYFSNQLNFELLGDRTKISSFAVAFGGRVADWLSLGAGVDISIQNSARTDVYVPDAADQSHVLLNPDIRTETDFAPYFAIATRPIKRVTLTSTLHLPTSVDTTGENVLRFWNYKYPAGQNAVYQNYDFSQGSEPLRFGVGASLDGPKRPRGGRPWQIGVQAVWTRWSYYQDRHGARPLDPWSDTISPSVGGSFSVHHQRISGDLTYIPSPVPDQTGRTNYVDNARVGGDVSFETPLHVFGAHLDLGFHVQAQALIPRSVTKSASATHPVIDEFPDNATNIQNNQPIASAQGLQTNNPGYPGYESEGWLLGAGLSVRLPR